MQANWSLMLNALLLVVVIVAIRRLMQGRKQGLNPDRYRPSLAKQEESRPYESRLGNDEIIAVRRLNPSPVLCASAEEQRGHRPSLPPLEIPREPTLTQDHQCPSTPGIVMMFLVAKEKRQFAGYELLQAVLAAGLRFGEGNLFHRHQFANGQGPVLCSLAAATTEGVFDLENIGAFSVRALCLFMQASKNPSIDEERFALMLETAKQLSEGIDARLLDDKRMPLTEERIARYHSLLRIEKVI